LSSPRRQQPGKFFSAGRVFAFPASGRQKRQGGSPPCHCASGFAVFLPASFRARPGLFRSQAALCAIAFIACLFVGLNIIFRSIPDFRFTKAEPCYNFSIGV